MKRYVESAEKFIVAAALLLTTLAGCKADNGKADPGQSARTSAVVPAAPAYTPPPAVAAETSDGRPLIVCFGDSITAGYGVDPALTYPADLQALLNNSGYRYRVVNMGISGETTKDGLARVQAVLARKPALVIVELGGNDGLRGMPVRDSQQNLTSLVTRLRQGGPQVLLAAVSLPAEYGPDYIGRFQAIYPAVSRQTGVPLLPFAALSRGIYGVAGNVQEDGIHPTASGDRILAVNVFAELKPLLKH